ncbi:hypothetical protein E2C01_083976 [Portunus trituberculatus]|uniref:Uncharacterized protein n=1 Tax=Portunus trituberculatus TaxID=210409 RepID=A0A5B7J7Y9_PORTR|nr:hypothetical protein [Portunus trituberculatus]
MKRAAMQMKDVKDSHHVGLSSFIPPPNDYGGGFMLLLHGTLDHHVEWRGRGVVEAKCAEGEGNGDERLEGVVQAREM